MMLFRSAVLFYIPTELDERLMVAHRLPLLNRSAQKLFFVSGNEYLMSTRVNANNRSPSNVNSSVQYCELFRRISVRFFFFVNIRRVFYAIVCKHKIV